MVEALWTVLVILPFTLISLWALDHVKSKLWRNFGYLACGFIAGLLCHVATVDARLGVDWSSPEVANDPEIARWYSSLMRPDGGYSSSSCCGEADAYWCDDLSVTEERLPDGNKKQHVFCAITDDRDDKPRGRPHREIGTKIEIPPEKMKWTASDPQTARADIPRNPTGHNIVFLSSGGYPYCFVLSSGV
jgi:hypothetical protein